MDEQVVIRTSYTVIHTYADGSSRETVAELSDDGTAIYVRPESGDWLSLHSKSEAMAVANAIIALTNQMEVLSDG